MNSGNSRTLSQRIRAAVAISALLGFALWIGSDTGAGATTAVPQDSIPNNHPEKNPGGKSATFSAQGHVDLTGEYFQAQGTNGRSCATCHTAEEAWSINPSTLQDLFDKTDGTHPIFNTLDANNPNMDVSTPEARLVAYSMMLSRGVFRRGGIPQGGRSTAELRVGVDRRGRSARFRQCQPARALAARHADDQFRARRRHGRLGRRQHRGDRPARRAGQPGYSQCDGRAARSAGDGRGHREHSRLRKLAVYRSNHRAGRRAPRFRRRARRPGRVVAHVQGCWALRFDLFDAWIGHGNPRRAQIARGQELFNTKASLSGRTCNGCHNAANNGANLNNLLFDVRAASAEARTPDLPLYTFRNKTTGETRQLTDAGQGNITGLWNDLGRFKTPTLRALAGRAPYFHNGIAPTLEDVVRHYERRLGFVFTDQERADLVAFLNAL
jgi:cytochrome c peroxidase